MAVITIAITPYPAIADSTATKNFGWLNNSFRGRILPFFSVKSGRGSLVPSKIKTIYLARPDPRVHVTQIRLFDNWLSSNQFADIVESLQSTPQMDRHRDIEREAALFRNSPDYFDKRAKGSLKAYDIGIDAAHKQINGT